MTTPTLDLLGIGNAIVDVLAREQDGFLAQHGMQRGAMNLIDAAKAEAIYGGMGPGVESSGGSAGNTCAVAAALGARVGFLGKVADDELGRTFGHDIRAAGVAFPTAPLSGGAPTARCLILVAPDGQRTMNTFLGACVHFGEDDVDEAAVASAAVTYLEGYLFDPPAAQAAFRRAAAIAHGAGRKIALTLSPSASAATATPSAPWCASRWTSSLPTRPRSCPCMKPRTSTRRCAWCAPRSASRR